MNHLLFELNLLLNDEYFSSLLNRFVSFVCKETLSQINQLNFLPIYIYSFKKITRKQSLSIKMNRLSQKSNKMKKTFSLNQEKRPLQKGQLFNLDQETTSNHQLNRTSLELEIIQIEKSESRNGYLDSCSYNKNKDQKGKDLSEKLKRQMRQCGNKDQQSDLYEGSGIAPCIFAKSIYLGDNQKQKYLKNSVKKRKVFQSILRNTQRQKASLNFLKQNIKNQLHKFQMYLFGSVYEMFDKQKQLFEGQKSVFLQRIKKQDQQIKELKNIIIQLNTTHMFKTKNQSIGKNRFENDHIPDIEISNMKKKKDYGIFSPQKASNLELINSQLEGLKHCRSEQQRTFLSGRNYSSPLKQAQNLSHQHTPLENFQRKRQRRNHTFFHSPIGSEHQSTMSEINEQLNQQDEEISNGHLVQKMEAMLSRKRQTKPLSIYKQEQMKQIKLIKKKLSQLKSSIQGIDATQY